MRRSAVSGFALLIVVVLLLPLNVHSSEAASKGLPRQGTLKILVAGVGPAGISNVVVTGPRFKRIIHRSTTLEGLSPGRYVLHPRRFIEVRGADNPGPDVRAVVVRGRTARVTAYYFFVPKTTLTITPSQTISVAGSAGSEQTLVLSSTAPPVKVGDILASGPTPNDPLGYLLKVSSVSTAGGQDTVGAVPATLSQAIPNGSLDLSSVLASLNSALGTGPAAVTNVIRSHSTSSRAFGKFGLECSGSASVDVVPSLGFSFTGANSLLHWDGFSTSGSVSIDFAVAAGIALTASGAADCTANATVIDGVGPTVVLDAGIPVVLTPTYSVKLKGTASLSASVSQTLSDTVGVHMEAQIPPHFTSVVSSPDQGVVVNGTASGSIDLGLTATVGIKIDGVVGLNIDANPHFNFNVTPEATPWWTMQGCIDGGFSADVVFDTVIDQTSALSWCRTLAKAAGSLPSSSVPTPSTLRNKVVTAPDKSSWFVDSSGFRHSIPDTDTFFAMTAKYGAAIVLPNQSDLESIPIGSPAIEPPLLYAPGLIGGIIQTSPDSKGAVQSWVVESDGLRHWIPNYATDLCAMYVKDIPVKKASLSLSVVGTIPLSATNYSCDLSNTILQAQDQPAPLPSYFYIGGQYHWIPDQWTFRYDTEHGATLVKVPTQSQIFGLPNGGTQAPQLNVNDLPTKAIIQLDSGWTSGRSWVIRSGLRELIPFVQDDVCWRDLNNYQVVVLAQSQIDLVTPASTPGQCIIGNAIVTSSDGTSYFVDTTNSRHWIPDTDTYAVLVSQKNPVYGPWPAADVLLIPKGTDVAPVINPAAVLNTIIRRSDGVSWVVDGSGVRHHIPYVQDDVCWRDLKNLPVSRTGLTSDQANSLPEGSAWPCVIGNAVVKSSDGTSYFVDTTNTRHWIPDTETFGVLAKSYPVYGPWPAADVVLIPAGPNQPQMINPASVLNTIIRRSDGVSWVVDGSGVRHHIPYVQDDGCWRVLSDIPVRRTGRPFDQANSMHEGSAWPCVIGNAVVKSSDGTSYFVDTTNTRHWIPDTETFGVLAKSYPVYGPWPAADVVLIPAGPNQPQMINPASVLNTIIRRSDGVSWVVDGSGVRHHIPYVQDDVCWRDLKNLPVSRTGLTSDQANSLPEGSAWPCVIGNAVVKSSDGTSYFVDTTNTRHWIPDTETFGVLAKSYPVYGPWPAADVVLIPAGPNQPQMINPASVL